MDDRQLLENGFNEIRDDWYGATLEEQEGYVDELTQLELRVSEIHSVEATKLLHDIHYLCEHIRESITPAQQKRAIDLWRASQDSGTGPG